MTLRAALDDLARVVADQAEKDPDFAAAVAAALARAPDPDHHTASEAPLPASAPTPRAPSAAGTRRTQPTLNPIQTARQGEEALRSRLEGLGIDALKDIVSAYALDPKRLAMRWKSAERLADLIVSASLARARKGDAFREQ